MNGGPRTVLVSGSLQRPSRTLALGRVIAEGLTDGSDRTPCEVDIAMLGRQLGNAGSRSAAEPELARQLQRVEQADFLVVAAPVYRASYPGLFKHFFDLVDPAALAGVPVLLAATGGSALHGLVIEHQLRPLFSFFQALVLPIGVYAVESDFEAGQPAGAALLRRIALAVERARPHLMPRPTPAMASSTT